MRTIIALLVLAPTAALASSSDEVDLLNDEVEIAAPVEEVADEPELDATPELPRVDLTDEFDALDPFEFEGPVTAPEPVEDDAEATAEPVFEDLPRNDEGEVDLLAD